MTWSADLGPSSGARLVLFAPDDPSTAGRRTRRSKLLAMRPMDRTVLSARQPESDAGTHWEYLLADDRTLLVRSRDFADADEAQWDAEHLFSAPAPLRPAFVRDDESGQLSWWLMRGDDPVIVASRVWLPSDRSAVVRSARRAVSALETRPRWGHYAG